MKISLTLISLLIFLGCTRKQPVEIDPTSEPTGTASQSEVVASEQNCFEKCEAYQKACDQLHSANASCLQNSKQNECNKSLDSMFALFAVDIFQFNTCKEPCWNIGNDNPITICEKGGGEKYKGLTAQTLDLLLLNKDPLAKALQLSKSIRAMGDKNFTLNFDNKRKTIKAVSPGRIFVVQESSSLKGEEKTIQFWLEKHELSCLGTEIQQEIKKNQKGSHSVNLDSFQQKIFKDCRLNDLQLYTGDRTQPLDKKGWILRYIHKAPENDECLFPVPRLEVSLKGDNEGLLFVPASLQLTEDESKAALADKFNERSTFFNLDVGEFLTPLEAEGKTYLVAPIPGIADCFGVYHFTDYGPVRINEICQSPCGS